MAKDFIKFLNAIENDTNLSLEEDRMLTILFKYYNASVGYAYPGYDVLMAALKTKRKAKVSKLLKSLVSKGYILINKVGKKNTYKLLKYLFIHSSKKEEVVNETENVALGEPDVNAPLDFSEEENKVIELGFTQKQAKSLLKVAKDKVDRILQAFNYATEKGADNLYSYTIWAINNINKVTNSFKSVENCWTQKKTKFDNFEARNYDYDSLERRLLGWDSYSPDQEDDEEEISTFNLKGLLAAVI